MTIQADASTPTRTPLTSAVAGTVSLIFGLVGGLLDATIYQWAVLLVVAAAACAIAVVDARTLRLPNALTAPLAVAGLGQVVAVAVVTSDGAAAAVIVLAAAFVFGAYALMAAAGWCGFGDAKFAGALALFVGLFIGGLAAYLVPVAIVLGGVQIALGRILGLRRKRWAHGPAIAIAACVLMIAGVAQPG